MTDKRLQYLTIVCFHILLVFVPLYFRFSTEELFEFNKLLVVYALSAVIGGLWMSRMIVQGKVLWQRTPFDIPLALFLASQVLATVFSIHPRTSWLGYYTRFHGGLLSYMAYTLLFYAGVNTLTRSHLKPLLYSALASATLVSVYGVLEHFGHSPSCLLITGGESFGVSCWIQDVQSRVFATFGQPNWLAAYVITLWPVAAWVALEERATQYARVTGFSVWVLLSAVLVYTRSRSGFLGLGVGIAVLVLLRLASWWWSSRSANTANKKIQSTGLRTKLLGIGIAVQVAVFVVLGTPFTPSLMDLLNRSSFSIPQAEKVAAPAAPVNRLEVGGTDSGEIRKIVWAGAIEVWKRYPLLGSGVETFAYSYYKDRPVEHNVVSEWDFLYNKAHNEVLNFFATTGTVGGLSYLVLVGWFFWTVWLTIISDKVQAREQWLSLSLAGGIAGLFVSNFFGFSTVMVTVLWYVYQAILSILAETDTHQEKQSSTTLSGTSWFGLGLTWFAVLIACVLVYRMYAADKAYALGKGLLSAGDFESGSAYIQQAIRISPREALYYDELAHHMSKAAVDVASTDASAAAQLATIGVDLSDAALSLNGSHLNFYKTRARIFITLAQLNPQLLLRAKEALLAALERAPSDAKIVYNLALVELGLGNDATSVQRLQEAVELKPNYGAARLELAKALISIEATPAAQAQVEYILQYINPGDPQSMQLLEQIATASNGIKKSGKPD